MIFLHPSFLDVLSTEEQWNDPISLKKVKSAYKSCIDNPGDDLIPETAVVDSEGGFPLVEATDPNYSSKFEWNDIADAMSKYGVPMIFGIRVNPNVINATKNLLYVNILFLVIVYVLSECF